MIEMTAQEAIMVSAPLLQEQSEFNVFKTVPKFAFPQVTQTESRSFSNFIPNLWAINPLSVNLTKWWNTQTICRLLPTNCLRKSDHFVGLALKRLIFNIFLWLGLFWSIQFYKEIRWTFFGCLWKFAISASKLCICNGCSDESL